MKEPYRIAHFSDFHLNDAGLELTRALRLVLDAIEQGADHLVITGDIVDAAQTAVVKAFWARLRLFGWTSGTQLTLCPGNHDVFSPTKRPPFLTFSRPTKCYEALCSVASSSFRGRGVRQLGNPYPVVKVLSSSVAIAALDTTRNGQYNPKRWAEGEIPEEDMEIVRSFFNQHLDKPHRIIAMHHTPFEVESESKFFDMNFCSPDSDAVQEWIINCQATLVLCGHVHCETSREKLRKRCWVLQSGTAGGCDEEGFPDDAIRTYHIIDLEKSGRTKFIERSFRGYELDKA